MRRRLPQGVRMYTGDDFNYAELIAGDEQGYSDALLGIFDAIAPAASAALGALARGDAEAFHDILAPTVPLSRHIFKAPTRFYKTGVVFMAYLNGLQDHFIMVGGQESARSSLHLAELFRLADAAGVLRDPDLAAARMRIVLAMRGVGRLMRDFSSDTRCSRSTARRSQAVDAASSWSKAARAHGITAIAPWRDRSSRPSASTKAGKLIRDARPRRDRLCRGGMFPAADEAGRRAALDDNRRAVDEAAGSARRAWCWSPAACRRARSDLAGRARAGARRHRRAAAACARRRQCRSPSSRCIRCTPPTAPA